MRKSLLIIGAVLMLASITFAATSLSYYGITWTFSTDRTTGTFANGEPWVVGPVTITNIDPNPSQSRVGWGTQHGSMINPVANKHHGFDSNPVVHGDGKLLLYKDSLNVALSLPFDLQAGDVLVSVKSRDSMDYSIETVCALTVLDAPAPAGSFRPGIFGADRTARLAEVQSRNISQLNWSVLKNLPLVTYTPTKATIQGKMPALPWFEWSASWNGYRIQPRDNTADGDKQYGRETAIKFGEVGLWLNTNQSFEDKQPIAIQMVQCGIDINAYIKSGGGFWPDGGHKHGRKLPLVMAAIMLNDPELKATAASQNKNLFQEDGQTWFVNQSDVNRIVYDPVLQGLCDSTKYTPQQMEAAWCGREFLRYRTEDVGKAEWGIRHSWAPFEDNASWSAGYRGVVWPSMAGAVLAVDLMGQEAAWGHPAIFAYNHRFKSMQWIGNFEGAMWAAYHPDSVMVAAPLINPYGGGFVGAQLVTLTCATDGAAIRYTTDNSEPTNSSMLYTGPFTVTSTTIVKARAFQSGAIPSVVSSAAFPLIVDGQTPYHYFAAAVPGRIEAEDFDDGVEGVAYHDLTVANQGENYRLGDGVDICGAAWGYFIGYIKAGEWLEYTINVAAAGNYDIEYRVANDKTGGAFHIEFDGVDKTGTINVPNTGAMTTFLPATKANVSLSAGQQVMRLVIESVNSAGWMGDLDYINIKPAVSIHDLFALKNNHGVAVSVSPNPMRNLATFVLPEKSGANAQVKIFDRDGRFIYGVGATGSAASSGAYPGAGRGHDYVLLRHKPAKERHSQLSLQWNGTDQAGRLVTPGVYYYTVTMDGRRTTGRIVVLPQDKIGR